MAKKKKGQSQSAIPFFMMAGFAFLAGFPIWLVLVLGLIGALVLKLEKDKKALSNLPPLPPADSDSVASGIEDSATPAAGPFGNPDHQPIEQPAAATTASLPQNPRVPPAPTYEEPTQAPELPPWASPDFQPYQAPEVQTVAKSVPTSATSRALGANSIPSSSGRTRAHPMARNLRSRQGARQAIVAMTVLGQPRALQPYEFDPIQQSDVAPGRSSSIA